MSITVSLDEAQHTLPDLLAQAASRTEEVVIERDGRPIARLIPIPEPPKTRTPGTAAGQFHIPPEFYEPMSEEELKEWGL